MRELLVEIWRDEGGLATVEYALLLVLIVIVASSAWRQLGSELPTKINKVSNVFAP